MSHTLFIENPSRPLFGIEILNLVADINTKFGKKSPKKRKHSEGEGGGYSKGKSEGNSKGKSEGEGKCEVKVQGEGDNEVQGEGEGNGDVTQFVVQKEINLL